MLCGFDDVRAMQAAGAPGFRAMGETRSRHLIDLLDKGPYTGEMTITGQGDIAVPCLISGSRLEDDDGAPSRYFATIADISQLREMYDSLESQNVELAASNRAKAQFLANMSHELRTPLNAIIGFSEIMRSELNGAADNPQYKEFSNHIHESGSHLLQLINDILDLSKIDAGKLELEDEIVDVRAAIESSVRLVQGRADAHSISLDTDIDAGLAPLRADDRKLKQVLINLMSNAIKFTPDGGAVMVTARPEPGGGLAIAVSDNGVGISEHDLSRVFSPFVQVDADLDRRYEGTGLGLPLTKAIVELHGGTVTLESRPGVGTTATVRLPAERVVASHETGVAAAG